MSWAARLKASPAVRFLLTGGINTALTFGLYALLKIFMNYQAAYFLSYVAGILIAYVMNSLFVFRQPVSLRTFIQFPLVYVVQYGVGALLLALMVQRLGFSATFAPLVVVVLTLPLTFLMSRYFLTKK